MKHFLVTSWPVIFYLFILHWSVSLCQPLRAVKPKRLPPYHVNSETHRVEQSRKPFVQEKITERRKGGNSETWRRPAVCVSTSRRVFKLHFMGPRIFAFQRKCPTPLVESRDPFRKRGPGLLFFGTLFCRSKRKYPQCETIRPQQYHYNLKRFS